MLGKNRIRRIEGLQRCCRLSVLDLHGNRITQISGLDNLAELKVLNLAGNQIRKICYMQGLISLEELVSTTYILTSKVLRKVKPDLCFENLSWQLKISKQNFGQGKRGHNFSCNMGKV